MKMQKKILMVFMMALLALSMVACDSTPEETANPDDPVANATQEAINDEEMEGMDDTASDEVPAEVIEQEPDPGVSEQEMATIPANAARSSNLLGHEVDLGNLQVIAADDVQDAAEEQAEGDMEDAAEEVEGEAEPASGVISDILINTTGGVEYVLLTISEGFADLNNTTVAVPWRMFQVAGMEDQGAFLDYHISFTGTVDELTTAPVIEEGMFDDSFWIDPNEYNLRDHATGDSLYLATNISDLNLINPAGEDLGEVEDLLIDVSEGVVSYAVTDFGGFLGMAETSTAVPWPALTFDVEQESYVLDVTQEQLENAPQLDTTMFNETIFDENWDADFADFWNNIGDVETN